MENHEITETQTKKWSRKKRTHKGLLYLASLWATMAAYQGKAETFRYDSMGALGKIKDMALSSDNKMFALKTTDAKIQGIEFPVWVGNADDLNAAYSALWMTNASPSCAFFKDKLYVAPKAETNHLYCVDVGTGHLPNVKSAKMLKFDAQGNTKMQAPYLYATADNLYAIENTANGVRVHPVMENDQDTLSLGQPTSVNSSGTKSIQTAQIKDIVSKKIDGQDCLYILTTNGAQTANLWLVKPQATTGECITPKEWSEYDQYWEFKPLFDHTTSIAVHGDKLLSANANYMAPNDEYEQLGYMFPIQSNGKLGTAEAYLQSDALRTSAIGSDQKTYYAEAIEHNTNNIDPSMDKYFLQADPKRAEGLNFRVQNYSNRSLKHKGAAVHKFTTQKEGEIFAISPECIYRIKNNTK